MAFLLPSAPTQPSFGGELGKGLGGGLSESIDQFLTSKRKEKELQQQQNLIEQQTDQLIQEGFSPQEARLNALLTTGGQTKLAELILDRIVRSGQPLPGIGDKPAAVEGEGAIFRTPSPDVGLTPKERVSREESRYKTNLPLYQATAKKLEGNETEGLAIQRLEKLNESGELPSGLQRWNIKVGGDNQGELRFPWLATADTQAFIKTINDFTTKAKDSFGSRVTNFELNRFMKRLPGLLNSEEGRRLVLRQMSIINEMNTLHNQSIVDTVEGAGGVRKIDYDSAERLAKRQNRTKIADLKKEYLKLESGVDKVQKKSQKLRKVEAGTKLTKDEAVKLLQQAGGDRTKAEKMAKQLGYDF